MVGNIIKKILLTINIDAPIARGCGRMRGWGGCNRRVKALPPFALLLTFFVVCLLTPASLVDS
jgi:hypothetical protein